MVDIKDRLYKSEPCKDNSYDQWIIRIDEQGDKLWDKTIGGNGDDALICEGAPSVFTVIPQPRHDYYWQIIPDDGAMQTVNNTTQLEINWVGQRGQIVLIDSLGSL